MVVAFGVLYHGCPLNSNISTDRVFKSVYLGLNLREERDIASESAMNYS